MNVWTYWEGPQPRYIGDCLASIARHCAGHRHLTPETVGGWVGDDVFTLAARLDRPAHRADLYRAALLARHGGLWLDADTVMIRPPESLLAGGDSDLIYAVWDNPPRRVFNGYVYAGVASPVAARWLAEVMAAVSRGAGGAWTSLGEAILTPLACHYCQTTRQVPRDTFCPVDVDGNCARLFQADDFAPLVKPHTICFGLNHSRMTAHWPAEMNASAEEMAASPLMIHRLLTHARSA